MSQGGASSNYAEYREKILEQNSVRARLKQAFPSWLGVVADILGILAVVALPLLGGPEGRNVASVCLVALAIFALGSAFYAHRRAQTEGRYAGAMRNLHLAIHILRDEAAHASQWDDRRMKACLAEVLGSFATAFSIITGSSCRTCIKVIKFVLPPGKNLEEIPKKELIEYCYARTFCRDPATQREIGNLPEGPTDAPVKHNKAFRFLFEGEQKPCFLGNDLPAMMKKGAYENTSTRKYGGESEEQWPLPYRATMVWPIRMVTEESPSGQGHTAFTGRQVIFGYLAVDTYATNVFHEKTDFEVGALLADALYMFLDFVYPLMSKEKADNAPQQRVPAESETDTAPVKQ